MIEAKSADLPVSVAHMRHHRYTNVTGNAIVRGSESGGRYKSKLEKHGFIRWLMQPEVRTARLQWPCIKYHDAAGKPHRYTGDLLVDFQPILRRRPLVVEFKYAEKLKKHPELKTMYAAVEAELNRRGYDFRLQTEENVYTPEFSMMKFVYGYRNDDPHPDEPQILACVASQGGLSLAALVQGISSSRARQAELIPAVWRLVALHRLSVDFSQVLDLSAKIRPGPVISG
jgi:hypothetical protein